MPSVHKSDFDYTLEGATPKFEKMMHHASTLTDPVHRSWYLTLAAEIAPEADIARLMSVAFRDSRLAENEFRRVEAGVWVLYHLVKLGQNDMIKQLLPTLIHDAELVDHPVGKAIAMSWLLMVTWSTMPQSITEARLEAVLTACREANSWRAGSILQGVAECVAIRDKTRGQKILDSMRDCVYKRRGQRFIDALESAVSEPDVAGE